MFHPAISDLRSILVIGAHADDIEIGCGGTLLRLLQANPIHVHWVVLSGNEERRKEARASAEYFLQEATSSEIEIESFPDRYFPGRYNELKDFFSGLGQRTSPDLILTHRREDQHQDHGLVGELTWNAFRDHWIFEYEIPKYEGDLGQPNVFVELGETHCREKIEAILKYYSTQQQKQWFSADTLWAMLRIRGVEADRKSRFAEAFHCRKMAL